MLKITMLLAHSLDEPNGNLEDKIELLATLTPQGYLDRHALRNSKSSWRTIHTRPDAVTRAGELVSTEEGWAIRQTDRTDDPASPFEPGIIRPGDYTILKGADDRENVYRIVSVEAE